MRLVHNCALLFCCLCISTHAADNKIGSQDKGVPDKSTTAGKAAAPAKDDAPTSIGELPDTNVQDGSRLAVLPPPPRPMTVPAVQILGPNCTVHASASSTCTVKFYRGQPVSGSLEVFFTVEPDPDKFSAFKLNAMNVDERSYSTKFPAGVSTVGVEVKATTPTASGTLTFNLLPSGSYTIRKSNPMITIGR